MLLYIIIVFLPTHMRKNIVLFLSIIIVISIICGWLIWNGTFFTINRTSFPDYPEKMSFYKKIGGIEIDIDSGDGINKTICEGFPPEKEVENLVKNYLSEHYYFPEGAIYDSSQMIYTEKISNNVVVKKTPYLFDISFGRELNEIPVYGFGNEIWISINGNGEVYLGSILWNNYSYAGEATIISPQLAYEKLLAHEGLVRSPMSYPNIAIDEISLCYYYIDEDSALTDEQNYLMPVWNFKGEDWSYYIKGYSTYEFDIAEE